MVTYICEYTAAAAAAKSLQSCPTLCDPRDGSPPGSSIPGILQARVLEWGATASPDDSSRTCKNDTLPLRALPGFAIMGF